jgi:hypothetical protein
MAYTNSKRQFLAGVEEDLDVEQAKRKKTVTWAVDGELDGEESPLEVGGSLSYQALDEIFRDIDETFLAQQGKLSYNKVEKEGLKQSFISLSPTPQQSWFKLDLGYFLTLLSPHYFLQQ